MPSDRKQINVRADDETIALVAELLPVVSAVLGLSVNQSDLFRLGLNELKKKYLTSATVPQAHTSPAPAASVPEPTAAKKPKGKKNKT